MRHTPGDRRGSPRGSARGEPGQRQFVDALARLDDMKGYQVAAGEPDVRGWPVKTADGRTAGRVDSLIVDTDAMQVRYLDVNLDRSTLQLKEERHVLVPLAHARLDDRNDDVRLDSMTAAEVGTLQPYEPGRPIIPGPVSEQRDAPPSEFYGSRAGSGAVRRHASGNDDVSSVAGTNRFPLTGDEEAVIQKRAVAREDVVIRRKHRDEPVSRAPSASDDDAGPGARRH